MALLRPGSYWRTVGELGTLGLSFVIALAIGTMAGLWIDGRFGTSPWGLLIGFGLGFAAAVLNVYRITTRALRPHPHRSSRLPTTRVDADATFLGRIERTALAFAVLATAAGGLLGGLDWAGGILGGSVLAGISYWAIRSSVDALIALMRVSGPASGIEPPGAPAHDGQAHDAAGPDAASTGEIGQGVAPPRPSTARVALSVVGRHALLGLVGYVIIARLRLHPVGVLIGASAVVLAAVREALRGPRAGSRS